MMQFGKRRRKATSGENNGHSIAVWWSLKNPSLPSDHVAELELHVNLWRLEERSNGITVNALDIGFLFSKANAIKTVHLFLPFRVDSEDLKDLTVKLDDAELAVAIFNDSAIVNKTASNESEFTIKLSDKILSCWKLDPATELSFENTPATVDPNTDQGTIITLSEKIFASIADDLQRYVRLRVILSKTGQKAFFTRYDPTDRPFLSGYDEIEVVDFRFNERRNLPRTVIGKMTPDIIIKELNYFVIRDMTEDLTLAQGELSKCRTLESYVWTKYIKLENDDKPALRNAVIFYWKKSGKEKPIRDYNALARFQRRKTGLYAISVFLLQLFLLGVVSGVIAGLLVDLLPRVYSFYLTRDGAHVQLPSAVTKGLAIQLPSPSRLNSNGVS